MVYSFSQELIKFLLNSTHNVLPTHDNLKWWRKTATDLKCSPNGFPSPMLKHILDAHSVTLQQGKYTWRHDNILLCLVKELESFTSHTVLLTIPISRVEKALISFVKEKQLPKKKKESKPAYKSEMLFIANDWVLFL